MMVACLCLTPMPQFPPAPPELPAGNLHVVSKMPVARAQLLGTALMMFLTYLLFLSSGSF